MCNRGGHKREKSVCMSTVSCAFFISVTVSQCRRGGERGCRGSTVKSTVKSTVGQGGSKGVYSLQ